MDRDEHLTQLRADGALMVELAGGDLDAPVPTCPDWTLAELLEHTGFVHRWQAAAVRDAPDGFPDPATWRHGPGPDQPLANWFRSGLDDVAAVVSAVDPGAPRWTWAGPGTAAWYARRVAHETLVHRIDAELAAGRPPTPVDPAVAVDGVDEFCDVFLPASIGEPTGGAGEMLHLHATDAAGEWLLTMHPDRVDVARGHAKGDVAVRGTALDLLLFVWGRPPLGALETFGDAAVAGRFTVYAST